MALLDSNMCFYIFLISNDLSEIKMSCPIFPENQNIFGLLLGFLAFYWFSTMSQLEVILLLRFLSLILIGVAIYLYCTTSFSFEIVILDDEDGATSNVISEELQEVKELVSTPAPESPHEESAEFADLVEKKNVTRKYRNNAT
jgi:hypothetical protein